MPDPGRSTDPRTVAGVTTSNVAATLTAAAGSFDPVGDVNRAVSGTGIPAGRTILSVNAAGSIATMNGNGNAVGTNSINVGAGDGQSAGFRGWSPETAAEANVLTVASKNAGATDHNRSLAGTKLQLQRSRY